MGSVRVFAVLAGITFIAAGCASGPKMEPVYFNSANTSPRVYAKELANEVQFASYHGNAGIAPSLWPVGKDGRIVISGFGPRGKGVHHGLDIKAPKNSAVIAVASGTVTYSDTERGYGKVVKIDHGNGYATTYAHLQENPVKVGQKIKQGQQIGSVGATGNATTPHVHFEIHQNGKPIDPTPFLR